MRRVSNPAKFKLRDLDDFTRQGFIGQWFGQLKLVGVAYQPGKHPHIEYVVCQVHCSAGHMQSVSWSRLRDRSSRRKCGVCNPKTARNPGTGSMKPGTILDKITNLDADRQRLFAYLVRSRRRLQDQDDTTLSELLRCTYEYCASPGLDPVKELQSWIKPGDFVPSHYGASSLTLAGGYSGEGD